MVTTLECTITGVTRSHCCRYSSCDNVSTVAEHVHHWRRLSQTLEPLESVVDEDPVFVRLAIVTRGSNWKRNISMKTIWKTWCRLTNFYRHIREVIKVWGIINTLDLDWYHRWSLSDVLPVNMFEPVQTLDIILALHPDQSEVSITIYWPIRKKYR